MQWVRTSWTKRSRGGEAAALRNAALTGFPVSLVPPSFAQVIEMSECDGFHPRVSERDLREVGLSLRDEGGRLRVLARVEPMFGLPPRPRRPPAVRLRPGQWVRWQLNYRFSSAAGMKDWSYWLDTFNVAYGPVAANVFVSEPTVLVDECGPVR
ncbi:hypothetical protein SAMN05414137_107294 [Streptacidiphilus jiangxiensis]|uniref:Uncharacterized protein n=1 Tax=Streptacidiphilus jiangxiensis TaxID=235985 RepID=A0A1H7PBI0_STRJI|nr:hypothetical protein SAMN05414137_107294 [Streptacidiphilus jiangxiensis]